MEVYRDEYYHELSKNCLKAIDTYPVVDPDLASFNLGDDFIDYRQHNPRIIVDDKKMKKMSRNMKCKTVKIS